MQNVRELIGQPVARKLLLYFLENDSPHLLIFCGPPGTGKTSAAEAYVKQQLCHAKTGCGSCPSCLKINRQRLEQGEYHPDYIRFPLEKINIGDSEKPEAWTVRWLIRTRLIYKPFESKHRYVLFPDAKLIGNEAETALLKTLEEPPPETFFILIADDASLLKETILSRGILVPFQNLSRQDIATLTKINSDEELDLMGGSLENNFWLQTDFYSELKEKSRAAFEHPLALLEFEKWLTDYRADKIKTPLPVSKEEMFDFALLEFMQAGRKLEQSQALISQVFQTKANLRRNLPGLLPYLSGDFFHQAREILFPFYK